MPVANLLQRLRNVVRRLDQLKREWNQVRQRHPHAVRIVAITSAAVAVLVIAFSVRFAVGLAHGLPDAQAIQQIGDMQQSTAVFDANDAFAFTIYEEQRIAVPLEQISPNLRRAIVAIEDQRFYEHHGFDVLRMVSAALTNLRHGRAVQGGSTITQQLARQSFLSPEKTIHRKLQELLVAERIEAQFSKPRILELYLNKVYFGDGLYGAEAASRGYFGKHASELTVPEAALLAGLVKSPSTYAPTTNRARALARRNLVLQAMLETGAIDHATWSRAHAATIMLHDTLRASEPHGQYFKEEVRKELLEKFGWQRVYEGGLRVFTTLDMPTQIASEQSVADQIKTIEERRKKYKNLPEGEPLQAALIAMDPATGHVRALVGGRDFGQSHFDRAVQARRQPGSAFKPFVYATALEAGYTPASVIDHLDEPIATLQGAWTPEDEHLDTDSMTMRTALRTSSNRAAVRMLQEVGIAKTVDYAKHMGVGDVPSVPSLALGSGEVTLESMTAAYAAFANHGLVPQPVLIRRVEERNGTVIFENHDESHRAIGDVTAFLMSSMLADVINAGTGTAARRVGFTLPAAGKTGTTNDFNDAWFVGYTPHLVAGVWVGFDQPHTILPRGFAADLAVPMWAKFMKTATKGDKPDWLLPPPGVTTASVCRISGKLATEGCQDVEVITANDHVERRSMVYTEYFAAGTEPTTYCDLHPTRSLFSKIAAAIGVQEQSPAPIHVDEAAPVATPTNGSVDAPPPPAAPAAKKRGFWSKLFGVGKDDGKGDRTKDEKKPRE